MTKVYIIEAENQVALELKEKIQSLGYEFVGSTDNYDDGVRNIIRIKPDIILIDVNIKDEADFIETATQIRPILNVPIICLTEGSDNLILERAGITNPHSYVIKSVEKYNLRISIEISLRVFEIEKKLRQNETSLSITLKSIGEGVIATDEYGIITSFNITAERMCGLHAEIAIGKPLNQVYNIISAIDRKPLQTPLAEVLSNGNIVQRSNHTILLSKDGTERHIASNAAPILDSLNQIHGIVLVFSDVTESYLNRKLLKQSEKLYREVIESATDVIYTTDPQGKFIFANASALKTTGYLKEELETHYYYDLISPEYRPKVIRHYYRQLIQKKKTTYLEFPFIRKDNGIGWFGQYATVLMNDENVSGFHIVARDITDRRKVEEALRKSELMFHTLANISPVGIFKSDATGYTTYVNQRWCEISGISAEEAMGDGWIKSVLEEDKPKLWAEWRDALKTNRASKSEYRCIKKDGSIAWVIGEVVPEIDIDNRVVGFVGTITDITDLKKNELEINMLANALKSIQEFVTIADLNNRVTFVNQSFINSYGYSEKEIIGRNIDLLNSAVNSPEIFKGISDVIINGCWQGELISIKKDGTEFPIRLSLTLITDEFKNPIAIIGVATDISLRKRHEAELIKLNQAVIQSPASIVITDTKGIIEYVNPKTIQISGYSEKELIGKNPRIFRSHKLSEDNAKDLWDTVSSGKEWTGEFYNRKKNGEVYCESASISPIKNDLGVITHYLAVREDITQRKKLELGLLEAKEKAEAASELKDAFIANISHEIRTPLNGLLGMTSILKDVFSKYITPDEEYYFDGIDRSSKRIIRTVDMILNFSRLQVGDFKSNPKIVNLGELISELQMEHFFLAKQKGLTLTIENKIGEVLIELDNFFLNQIISNLLDNAIKYTKTGSVNIILYKDKDNRIKIDISDTGIGISDNYMDKLFQPYTQEDGGFTRPYEGVGLGLSLVKKFLLLIDADISVKSKKKFGTTFTIMFKESAIIQVDPLCNEKKLLFLSGHSQTTLGNVRLPSVLIIEDEQINQLYLSVKLKPSHNITVVENSTDALRELEKKHFDIILMDISLKEGLNGIELTRLLKETVEYKNIPIIAVTGHAFNSDREKCMNAGCDDYISKPFQVEELEKKINKLIIIEK